MAHVEFKKVAAILEPFVAGEVSDEEIDKILSFAILPLLVQSAREGAIAEPDPGNEKYLEVRHALGLMKVEFEKTVRTSRRPLIAYTQRGCSPLEDRVGIWTSDKRTKSAVVGLVEPFGKEEQEEVGPFVAKFFQGWRLSTPHEVQAWFKAEVGNLGSRQYAIATLVEPEMNSDKQAYWAIFDSAIRLRDRLRTHNFHEPQYRLAVTRL